MFGFCCPHFVAPMQDHVLGFTRNIDGCCYTGSNVFSSWPLPKDVFKLLVRSSFRSVCAAVGASTFVTPQVIVPYSF